MAHRNKLRMPFVLSVVGGTALYAVLAIIGDLHNVGSASIKLGVNGWSTILGLSLLNYGLRFIRWQSYLVQFGYRIPIGRHIAYYLSGFAFTITPGKAGEAVRTLYLKNYRVAYRHSLAALVVERFIDVMAMVLMAMTAGFAFERARWPVAIMTGVIIVLLSVLHRPSLRRFLGWLSSRSNSEKMKRLINYLQELLRACSELLARTPLCMGFLLGILSWGAEGLAFSLILEHLGIHIPMLLAIGIYATGILAGAVSFLPGGLGSTEAVIVLLLTLVGTEMSTAVAATLICRIATLWFAVAIGLLAMGALEIGRSRQPAIENQ